MMNNNCCGGECGGGGCDSNEIEESCCADNSVMQVGNPAPGFCTKAYVAGEFKDVELGDYRGKWVVLFFYPRDFTFICPTEIKGFAEHEDEFKKDGAVIIGASTDSEWCHKAWFEKDLPMVKFPVLADTNHEVAARYGVLLDDGAALRGTFIIDPNGILRYSLISDLNVGRSVEETLRVLKALQTGEKCPIDWKPGQSTLGK